MEYSLHVYNYRLRLKGGKVVIEVWKNYSDILVFSSIYGYHELEIDVINKSFKLISRFKDESNK